MFRTNRVVHRQERGIIYCITQFGTLCCAAVDERLYSFETCRADKKLWNKKNDYKDCASRWSLTHYLFFLYVAQNV